MSVPKLLTLLAGLFVMMGDPLGLAGTQGDHTLFILGREFSDIGQIIQEPFIGSPPSSRNYSKREGQFYSNPSPNKKPSSMSDIQIKDTEDTHPFGSS